MVKDSQAELQVEWEAAGRRWRERSRRNLNQGKGKSRWASIRALASEERVELLAHWPKAYPDLSDQLRVVDLRFPTLNSEEDFGALILPQWSSQGLWLETGGEPDYWIALETASDRRPVAEEVASFLVWNGEQRTPLPFHSVLPLHLFEGLARSRGLEADELSMAQNNCTGFALRRIRQSERWSRHAAGALDLNPAFNPLVMLNQEGRSRGVEYPNSSDHPVDPACLEVQPPCAGAYALNRQSLDHPMVLHWKSPAVQWFRNAGWSWGGDWHSLKDYQHFSIGDE
ncbi:MAG: M15 family peptidase [Planctomycetota bacterium]|nr:MAG: M15 family peptidase [Planctomycetota bacterium]